MRGDETLPMDWSLLPIIGFFGAIAAGFVALVAADSPWSKERFLWWLERPKARPTKRALKRAPRKILGGVFHALLKGVGLESRPIDEQLKAQRYQEYRESGPPHTPPASSNPYSSGDPRNNPTLRD